MEDKEQGIEERKLDLEWSKIFFGSIFKLLLVITLLSLFSFLMFSGAPDLLDGIIKFLHSFNTRC